jgi:23S rRNA pseudouridine2605 synthase
VLGTLSDVTRRRLLQGVVLEDGEAAFARLEALRGGSGRAANQWYRVVLREGRTREVRRLFEAVGLQVSRLMRVRFGTVRLPRTLQAGRWIELDARQCAMLLAASAHGGAAEVVPERKSC